MGMRPEWTGARATGVPPSLIRHMFELAQTVGAMEALLLTFLVALDPGDEVLITDPSYTNYAGQVILAEGRPVFVATDPDRGYLPDAGALEAAVTPRTRAILINSPSNPTGA